MLAALPFLQREKRPFTIESSKGTAQDPSAARIHTNTTVALAAHVFDSAADPVLTVGEQELASILERMKPNRNASASTLLHALHLFGGELTIAIGHPPGRQIRILDLLLDARRGADVFDGALTLVATRYGVRAPLHEDGLLGTSQPSAEAHPGQLLSILAEIGVPLSRPIRLADGTPRTVAAIRDDVVANFSLEGEIAWDAVAMAVYADGPRWRNKFGRDFDFDRLANELMSRNPRQASCGGTHDLLALTVILKADDRTQLLSTPVRNIAWKYVEDRVAQCVRSQRGDGAWGLDWHGVTALPTDSATQHTSRPSSRASMIATGHLMEWLLLLPSPVRPGRRTFENGARWLLGALRDVTPGDHMERIREQYCPLTHATRSLRLLARTERPAAH